jgi:uncharacterized protein YndB with AHSA1/START domain
MADTYTVSRSATIDAPPEVVYGQLADFRAWTAWSPWEDLDPAQQRTYSGADSGQGARYAWSGNRKAGQGTMEITRAEPGREVAIALSFVKPFRSSNTTTFELRPEGGGTHVTWSMVGQKTLGLKVMGVVRSMDKMLGPDFEKGLRRLKAVCESKA